MIEFLVYSIFSCVPFYIFSVLFLYEFFLVFFSLFMSFPLLFYSILSAFGFRRLPFFLSYIFMLFYLSPLRLPSILLSPFVFACLTLCFPGPVLYSFILTSSPVLVYNLFPFFIISLPFSVFISLFFSASPFLSLCFLSFCCFLVPLPSLSLIYLFSSHCLFPLVLLFPSQHSLTSPLYCLPLFIPSCPSIFVFDFSVQFFLSFPLVFFSPHSIP